MHRLKVARVGGASPLGLEGRAERGGGVGGVGEGLEWDGGVLGKDGEVVFCSALTSRKVSEAPCCPPKREREGRPKIKDAPVRAM